MSRSLDVSYFLFSLGTVQLWRGGWATIDRSLFCIYEIFQSFDTTISLLISSCPRLSPFTRFSRARHFAFGPLKVEPPASRARECYSNKDPFLISPLLCASTPAPSQVRNSTIQGCTQSANARREALNVIRAQVCNLRDAESSAGPLAAGCTVGYGEYVRLAQEGYIYGNSSDVLIN